MLKLVKVIRKIFQNKPPVESQNYEELQADIGVFKYTEDGFIITLEDFTKAIKWTDITEISVYKKDLITIDEIRMNIVFGDQHLEISEELPGWFQFVSRTKGIFPTIPKDWDIEIIQPAFATNYKTIYSK